jgi:predicted membrane-bound mannosyltransferase
MKLKNKNKLVAWILVGFMIFVFFYTIYNITGGIFDRPL